MTECPKLKWHVYCESDDGKSSWEGTSPDGEFTWCVTWSPSKSRWFVFDARSGVDFNIEAWANSVARGGEIAQALFDEQVKNLSKTESVANNLVTQLLQ